MKENKFGLLIGFLTLHTFSCEAILDYSADNIAHFYCLSAGNRKDTILGKSNGCKWKMRQLNLSEINLHPQKRMFHFQNKLMLEEEEVRNESESKRTLHLQQHLLIR